MDPKIVIVANRGPNDFVYRDGKWVTRPAAGGLVSMLAPLARQPNVAWFCCVSEPPDAVQARRGLFTTAIEQTDPRLHIEPVLLPAAEYHAYYGLISNEVLWMLQHQLINQSEMLVIDYRRHRAWREGYLAANRRVAEAIRRTELPVGAFLLQDYHLYPLPQLLREAYPDTPSLHFTHIPFPEAPLLKLLPRFWRHDILRGLLGADVVGMQTLRDVRAFLSCCEELNDVTIDSGAATVTHPDGREVRVRAFGASTDPRALRRTMRTSAVARAHERLAPDLDQLTVIRVDRLDPSKNQLIGFLAFERLLEMRPDLRGKVRFLAFLVPSRTDLSIYRIYGDAIYRKIEEINDRFATDSDGPPIRVFYTNDREQALAAMEACDVLLINSFADGMNLVAKEWALVSRRPGVVIVSETAGVAEEFGDDALRVSPLDAEGTAQALVTGLEMSTEDRSARLERIRRRVNHWTAADWLSSQLKALGVSALAEGR